MKSTETPPIDATRRQEILARAQRLLELPYDELDALLLDLDDFNALADELQGVLLAPALGEDDILDVQVGEMLEPSGRSDASEFKAYAAMVRSIPRMDRDQEHRLGRRLEFARLRLQRLVGSSKLPEDALERVLDRGLDCDTLREELTVERPELDVDDILASLPCRSCDPYVNNVIGEYDRLRRHFVERNLAVVVGMSSAYRTYDVPLMDLVQEGNASLIRAVEKYDWRKGVRFQTYAAFWVRQAVERLITANRGIVRVPNYIQQKLRRLRREGKLPRNHRDVDVKSLSEMFDTTPQAAARLIQTDRAWTSLDAPVGKDDDGSRASLIADPDDAAIGSAERRALGRRLEEVLSRSLTEQEHRILRLRFGLDGAQPETLDQIGSRMNVSRERIRQLQVKALGKLQDAAARRDLEDFLS